MAAKVCIGSLHWVSELQGQGSRAQVLPASCRRMAAGGHETGTCPSCCVCGGDINNKVWRELDGSGRLPGGGGLGLGLEFWEKSTQAGSKPFCHSLLLPSPMISRETSCSPSLFRGTAGILHPRGRAALACGWHVGAGRKEPPRLSSVAEDGGAAEDGKHREGGLTNL